MLENKFIQYITEKRNHLFLGMCIAIHILSLITFLHFQIKGMVILNIFSTIFYLILIFILRNFSEDSIVIAYYEIIIYAFISTIMTGKEMGFELYILGMLSGVFYMAYNKKKFRMIHQILGAIVLVIIQLINSKTEILFVGYKEVLAPYYESFYMANLILTIVSLIYIAYLYGRDMDRVYGDLKKAYKMVDYKASHDELTGLMNRFNMNKIIKSLEEEHKKEIIVAMIDIDNFKQINDMFGHNAGDEVIKQLANSMKEILKEFHIARWGGEEFLIVTDKLEKQTAINSIIKLQNEIRNKVIICGENRIRFTFTAGITHGTSYLNINQLILESDNRLYEGKKISKDCIVC